MVQNEDLGYYLRVMATGTGSYSGIVISEAKGPVVEAQQTIPITGISDILYTTVPDLTLKAGILMPIGAEATYQWQVSDTTDPDGSYSNIAGATSNTYTIPANQALGRYFRVVVTGTGIYSGTITSNYTGPVVSEAIPVTGVSISGVSQEGETLSAVLITPSSATVTYQWYTLTELGEGAIALVIPGAVYSNFTPSNKEYNYYIRVVVTGSGAYTSSVSATTTGKVMGVMNSATVNMTAPVAGEVPQTAAEVEADTSSLDYTVTGITWNEDLEGGAFKADTVYTATIELTAKNSKTFQAASFTPVVSSAVSVGTTTAIGSGANNKVVFIVTLPQTGSLELKGLLFLSEDLELTEETKTDIESDILTEPLAEDLLETEEPACEEGLEPATAGDAVTETSIVNSIETETEPATVAGNSNSEELELTENIEIESDPVTEPLAEDILETEEHAGEEGLEPVTEIGVNEVIPK